MKRHKKCETECKLKQGFGQSCGTVCQMQQLTDSVFNRSPLKDWLRKKGWK